MSDSGILTRPQVNTLTLFNVDLGSHVPSLAYMDRVSVIREHSSDIQSIVLPKLVKMLQLTGVVQETAPKVLGMVFRPF